MIKNVTNLLIAVEVLSGLSAKNLRYAFYKHCLPNMEGEKCSDFKIKQYTKKLSRGHQVMMIIRNRIYKGDFK